MCDVPMPFYPEMLAEGEACTGNEIADSAVIARLEIYRQLARLFAHPDADTYAAAAAGEWPHRLAEAASLLPFDFDYDRTSTPESAPQADFEAEYLRLFEAGNGLYGGIYGGGDRMKKVEEVARFYEYFGLRPSAEDPRPPDHLSTEFQFMELLAHKEATAVSPLLQVSLRRAQRDFLDRQLRWLPNLVEYVDANSPMPFWRWATATAASFAAADAAHVHAALA